jgi:hypothetical protein
MMDNSPPEDEDTSMETESNQIQAEDPTASSTMTTSIERHPTLDTTIQETPFQVSTSCEWMSEVCRPAIASGPSSDADAYAHDAILSLVFEYIHRETPYYVSCGAKFGADYLIYDGPRDERHAFAGLKVLSSATTATSTTGAGVERHDRHGPTPVLPIPTAYSLTSFVRCLNTAGKVALLATAVVDVEEAEKDHTTKGNNNNRGRSRHAYRVVFVDVALEKVLDAPTHKKRRRGGSGTKRRDVTQNLAKTNNS